MGIHSRAVATARRLIRKHGRVATWRSLADPVEPVGGPVQPWKASNGLPTDNDVRMVFLPLTKENAELLRYLGASDIAIGSELGLMEAVSFNPSLRDVVIDGGVERRIKNISKLKPGEEVIFYTVEFQV